MKCAIFWVVLFAIVSLSTAGKPAEKALLGSNNALVGKVQCVVDTMDKIADEFQCDAMWKDIQEKIIKYINNLFLCLKSKGFQLQR